MIKKDLGTAAQWLKSSRNSIAFTGAGISVDSGIPDFRSPGGLWERFDPMEYATIQAFQRDPEKVWTMLHEMSGILEAASPNPGHRGLRELESMGLLHGIITQNIDNLHQEAGSRRVVEYHGNGRRLLCLSCGENRKPRFSVSEMKKSTDGLFQHPARASGAGKGRAPRCPACGEILKPDVVLFGEDIPRAVAREASDMASSCDLMLVVGTSADVYPAAELPAMARSRGARIIEINKGATRLTGQVAHLSLVGLSSRIIPDLVELVS